MNSLSPSFAPFRRVLPWTACLGLLLAFDTVAAQEEVTSFEDSEGFAAGSILPGRAGWEGTPGGAALRNLIVTAEEFYKGGQSLQANNAAGAYAFAQSPDLYQKGFTGVSFFLKNPGAQYVEANQTIARWEVLFGDGPDTPSTPRIVVLLRYTSPKAFSMNIGPQNDALKGSTNRNILSASAFKLDDWNEVDMDFDFAGGVLTIRVNGTPLSNTIQLNPEKVTAKTRITGIRFATPASASEGVTYFDMVTGRSGAKAN